MRLVAILWLLMAGGCLGQKVAITFDDLPLNGNLPPEVTRAQIARDTIRLLKARQAPPVYGLIFEMKMDGIKD